MGIEIAEIIPGGLFIKEENTIDGKGLQDEDEEQQGDAQPERTVFQELQRALGIIGFGDEVAGDEEEKAHKEGLKEYLVGGKCESFRHADLRVFHEVPATQVTVGDGGVHAEHQHDHDPAEVIYIQEAGGMFFHVEVLMTQSYPEGVRDGNIFDARTFLEGEQTGFGCFCGAWLLNLPYKA